MKLKYTCFSIILFISINTFAQNQKQPLFYCGINVLDLKFNTFDILLETNLNKKSFVGLSILYQDKFRPDTSLESSIFGAGLFCRKYTKNYFLHGGINIGNLNEQSSNIKENFYYIEPNAGIGIKLILRSFYFEASGYLSPLIKLKTIEVKGNLTQIKIIFGLNFK